MKEKTKEIIVGYEAFDGTFFKSEDECRSYETTANNVIKKMFLNLASSQSSGEALYNVCEFSYDNEFFAITPKSLDEIEVINRAMAVTSCSRSLSPEYIGKNLVFVRNYDGDIWFQGEVEKICENFRNFFEKMFK